MSKTIPLLAAIVALGSFVILDLNEVRTTGAEVKRLSTGSIVGSNIADETTDLDRVRLCNLKAEAAAGGVVLRMPIEWRDCAKLEIPNVKTYLGGSVFATQASGWLKQNPEDAEFRETAKKTIDVMRADLAHSKLFVDALEAESAAQQASFVYRLIWPKLGNQNLYSTLSQKVSMLDDQIQSPKRNPAQSATAVSPNR